MKEKGISSYDEGIRIIDGSVAEYECLKMDLKRNQIPRRFHYHDYTELLYGIKGTTDAWIFDKHFSFSAGELLVINPREAHTFSTSSGNASSYIVIKFLPEVICCRDFLKYMTKYTALFELNQDKKRVFSSELGEYTGSLMHEALDEWTNKPYGYDMVIKANITKVFSSVLRYFCAKERAENKNASSEPYSKIKKAIPYIKENFITADARTAAELCGLNYEYFSRNFKKATGKGFSDYLSLVRLTEAERLLLSTSKTVTEIAYDTGFSSASHFIKAFHKQKGSTPKQFRKNIYDIASRH